MNFHPYRTCRTLKRPDHVGEVFCSWTAEQRIELCDKISVNLLCSFGAQMVTNAPVCNARTRRLPSSSGCWIVASCWSSAASDSADTGGSDACQADSGQVHQPVRANLA